VRARAAALALLLVLAGCGGSREAEGSATLWVTRDEGSRVLYEGSVPAGLTVLQALDRHADVETRYGGRFVQSVDGLEGSLTDGRDWFYFVNGVAADRSAVEYRLRDGEVAWWDFRAWRGEREVDVVVGAFPEPLVHGYDGERKPTVVRFALPEQRASAKAIGRLVRASSVARAGVRVPEGANVVRIVGERVPFTASASSTSGPYVFTLGGDAARRLARDPTLARFRYEGLP
jgi:Domain of unknown function (DUF4430)